jgi:hypothetical protein
LWNPNLCKSAKGRARPTAGYGITIPSMDTIAPDSLAWALAHTRKFSDTDIFPYPFEFDSIAHDWISFSRTIGTLNLHDYKVGTDRRAFVPKPGGGFRAAIQLDPIDQLIYTASIYEIADLIEKCRIPEQRKVACSYRLSLTPDGAFFAPDSGWRDFHAQSRVLAKGKHSHVLVADIADFYNQLSHHRIQNALELASVSHERSSNLERFLGRITAKQSRGLPVGPFASVPLAEACLNDVDNFLLRQGCKFVRYVDDFRIFCRSRKEAIEVRHALTEYLFTAHRLSLESSKTKIVFVDRFVKDELNDPEELEQRAKIDRLNELIEENQPEEAGWYSLDPPETPDEEVLASQAEQESFAELFRECVLQPPLQLGLAKHLLRKATRRRTVVLNDMVVKSLESLAPLIRDVVRCLAMTIPKNSAKTRGAQILRFAREDDSGELPFVRMWILELLSRRPDLLDAGTALKFAEESTKKLGLRAIGLVALSYKQADWVRGYKETWKNHAPWDRRTIIWAASMLPKGEKKPFLQMVTEDGDPLDAAVAKHAQSV